MLFLKYFKCYKTVLAFEIFTKHNYRTANDIRIEDSVKYKKDIKSKIRILYLSWLPFDIFI